MKKPALKVLSAALCAALFVPLLTGASSYEDTYPWEVAKGDVINVDDSVLSYAYQLRRQYTSAGLEGDARSTMGVWNVGRAVQSGAIRAQVFIKVYCTDIFYPDRAVTYYGTAATNTEANAAGNKMISSIEKGIDYPQGATCLGNAIVRRPDLVMVTLKTSEYMVGTTGDWGYNGEIVIQGEPPVEVGADGLTYGAPYVGEDGLIAMPDMIYSEATNGEFGYVSSAMLDAAIVNYAETPEEEMAAIAAIDNQKAAALRSAFAEYYGADVLSFEDAMDCANQLVHEEGVEGSRATAIASASAALAEAVRLGEVTGERAVELLGTEAVASAAIPAGSQILGAGVIGGLTASDVTISAAAYEAILDIARAQVAIHLPVYADDGTTIVGEVVIDRF